MNIDDTAMKSVVAKAILDSLTPEVKATLITNAIASVISEKVSTSYNAPTVLQYAFNQAVRNVAEQVARDMLADDQVLKEKLKTLMLEAWEKLAGGEAYTKLIENVSSAMAKGISGDRY